MSDEKKQSSPSKPFLQHKKAISAANDLEVPQDTVPIYKSSASLFHLPSAGSSNAQLPSFRSAVNLHHPIKKRWTLHRIFGLIAFVVILIGVVTLVMLNHYRQQQIEYEIQQGSLTGSYSNTETGFEWPMDVGITLKNPNRYVVMLKNLEVMLFHPYCTASPLVIGSIPSQSISAHTSLNVTIPTQFNYSTSWDTTNKTCGLDICLSCGLLTSSFSKPFFLGSSISFELGEERIVLSLGLSDGLWRTDCPVTISELPPALTPFISGSLVQALHLIGGGLNGMGGLSGVTNTVSGVSNTVSGVTGAVNDVGNAIGSL